MEMLHDDIVSNNTTSIDHTLGIDASLTGEFKVATIVLAPENSTLLETVVALAFPAMSWYSNKNEYFVPSTKSIAGAIASISDTTEAAVDKRGTFIV
jgi:hypothetical protein